MQPLDLNLSSRPFRNNLPLWIGCGAGLALLIGFTIWNIASYSEHTRLLGELRSEVDSLESQTRDLEQRDRKVQTAVRRFDLDALAIQASKANEIIEWKAFSWTQLFNLMAEIQPNAVRMASVRPIFGVRGVDAAEALARGTAEQRRSVPVAIDAVARSYDDVMQMQRVLFDDPHFGDVVMERLRRRDKGTEYLFQARFLYYPDAEPAEPALVEATQETPPAEVEPTVAGAEDAENPPAERASGATPQQPTEAAPGEEGAAGDTPGTAARDDSAASPGQPVRVRPVRAGDSGGNTARRGRRPPPETAEEDDED